MLDGGGKAGIFYAYTGNGRCASFRNLTFANGTSAKNGGGIYSLGPAGDSSKSAAWGIVSNCVFRNCSAASGGGTYCYTAEDSLYENCTAAENGGGAWGEGSSGYKNQATNHFARCVFRSCRAGTGGALRLERCHATTGERAGYVADCVFSNCTATTGGALYEENAGLVRGCRFEGNASHTGAVSGNTLYDTSLITNCVFVGNVSGGSGGGIGRWGTVEDCAFTGNVATNTGGAAVACKVMRRCAFTNNMALCVDDAAYGGGALSNVTAVACIFSGNASAGRGGAMAFGTASNCVFTANVSTNQGGACVSVTAVGCTFTDNRSRAQRGGAMFWGWAEDCAFTNNYVSPNARGGACAFTRAKNCVFSGVGDVSCGNFDHCLFDGVVSDVAEKAPKWVFDCVYHSGLAIGVTNCLVVNCAVDRLIYSEGQSAEFVNCTFADNTLDDGRLTVLCTRGTDYTRNADGTYRYYPGTVVLRNCLFSGNRFVNGTDADLRLWKYTEDTGNGVCSIQLLNCLYTAGPGNLSHAEVNENLICAPARFAKSSTRFPDAPPYSLRHASAARDAGVNAAWMASATDMAGAARLVGGTVDIGCYECILPEEGTLFIVR